MVDAFPWILVAVLAAVVVLGLVYFFWKKGKAHKPAYKTWFYIGIVWMAMGLPLATALKQPPYYGFFVIGVVFAVLGWLNRDKWEDEKSCCWPWKTGK